MHTWKSMAVPSPWIITNLTMYSASPAHAVAFSICGGEKSAKLDPLAKFYAQLVVLAAWQLPRIHQGTHRRFYHSIIFQL